MLANVTSISRNWRRAARPYAACVYTSVRTVLFRVAMKGKFFHQDAILIALVGLCTGLAFFCFSPYRIPDPHRDSGIFLNIGAEILRGKVVYQQIWDTKPPLVYFINALGLWAGQGSWWGVWGLELIALLATVLSGYAIVRQKLPPFSSFFVTAASFLAIFPFLGGNYTEEYSLVFQMGILAVVLGMYLPDRGPRARALAAIAAGALAGLGFCIKQTYVDVFISSLLLILFLAWVEQDRRILRRILLAGLGFGLANLPFWLYFYLKGAFNDYWISAFLFNRYYVRFGLLEWVHTLLEKIEFITSTPFLLLASSIWLGSVFLLLIEAREIYRGWSAPRAARWVTLGLGAAGWLLFFAAQAVGSSPGIGLLEWGLIALGSLGWGAALFLFLHKPADSQSRDRPPDLRSILAQGEWHRPGAGPLLFLGLVDLPVAVFSISLSGKDFSHYYISLFPAVFLLLAGGLTYLHAILVQAAHRNAALQKGLNALLAAVLAAGSFAPALQVYAFLSNPGAGDARFAAAAYLKANTTPDDKILVWGWESVIYFLAERESPTRYAIQFAAYLDSPYQENVLKTLLADLQTSPPLYIADTLEADMPLLEGRSGSDCISGSRVEDPRLLAIISFVCSNYSLDQSFDNIRVYKQNR